MFAISIYVCKAIIGCGTTRSILRLASAKSRWLRIDKLLPPVNLCLAMPEGDGVLNPSIKY